MAASMAFLPAVSCYLRAEFSRDGGQSFAFQLGEATSFKSVSRKGGWRSLNVLRRSRVAHSFGFWLIKGCGV